jgi:hypothetical protein
MTWKPVLLLGVQEVVSSNLTAPTILLQFPETIGAMGGAALLRRQEDGRVAARPYRPQSIIRG